MARRRKNPSARYLGRTPLPFPFDDATWAQVVDALGLSPQQARIVERLLCGMCDKQIALGLGIRLPTVRTYLTRVFRHLGVDDRVQLVLRVFAEARSEGAGCRQD